MLQKETDVLISDCRYIVERHSDTLSQRQYNIYRLLHVTNKEVQMCRILADFLDPNGSHREGAKYLLCFFRDVLCIDVAEKRIKEARVYKEYPITNDRRIDIVISYHGGFIPIEVKINAEDQENQCYDYLHFAKKKDKNAFIVYLTKSGYMPSEYSLKGAHGERLNEKDVRCISFKDDILNWLKKIKLMASEEMVPMIDQYIGAVIDFVNNEDEKYKMELSDKILNNSGSLRTSLEIVNAIDYAKAELMKRLFKEFENQMIPLMDKYNLVYETRSKWFNYEYQATEDFYAHSESTYPGLNYVVSSVPLGEELSLWLRIEVEYRLFAGLCLFDYSAISKTGYEIGNQCDNISDELWGKLRDYVILPENNPKEGWFVAWKYLPTGSDSTKENIDSVPEFKGMNAAAIELADEEKRVEFVAKCIKIIEDTLLVLIK